jgi:hypothetical protein
MMDLTTLKTDDTPESVEKLVGKVNSFNDTYPDWPLPASVCVYSNFAAVVKLDGSMAVLEGTWTTPRAVIPSGPEILCTDGVVVCTGGAENAPDVKVYDIYGKEIDVPNVELDDSFKNMPWQIASGNDIFPMLTLDANVEMMAILDAVIKSTKSGKEEKISD